MEIPMDLDSAGASERWKCGDPYQYSIPEPDGNPWEVVLKALLKKDKVQCDAWKDEVQNLLIFAGLFSAVVTAFVMESYKSLLPDSGDISVVLLARIAVQIGAFDTTNSSNVGTPTTQSLLELSSSSSSAPRVNALWFLSLILSLTTVLIGIISLQWLREHQIYNDSLSPQQSIGVFHMRAEALERWYVPNIFSTLPLLLEASLILFFIGIVDFLFDLSNAVAIPVAVAVGFATVFLILTTTLPLLQCFPVSLRQPLSDSPLPAPCPYKSPQSLAVIKFSTFSRRCFTATHELVVRILHFVTFQLPSFTGRILNLDKLDSKGTWNRRLRPDNAYYYWAHRSWINFDRTWIRLRNEHFDVTRKRKTSDSSSFANDSEAFYDTVRAIATAVHMNEHRDAVVFAGYHCFQDLSRSEFRSQHRYLNHHLQACYHDLLVTASPLTNVANTVSNPSFELLHDIHTALRLSSYSYPGYFTRRYARRISLGNICLRFIPEYWVIYTHNSQNGYWMGRRKIPLVYFVGTP